MEHADGAGLLVQLPQRAAQQGAAVRVLARALAALLVHLQLRLARHRLAAALVHQVEAAALRDGVEPRERGPALARLAVALHAQEGLLQRVLGVLGRCTSERQRRCTR